MEPKLNQGQYRVLRYLSIQEDPEGDYITVESLNKWHYPELQFWQPKTLIQVLGKLVKGGYAYVAGLPGRRSWKISEKGHEYLKMIEAANAGR